MAMNFDQLISSLHETTMIDEEVSESGAGCIIINKKRQFIVPEGYNIVLGYEGDVNSQIVTFELPSAQDGHSLEQCGNKIIKWKNLANGVEGKSALEQIEDIDEFRLTWFVPSEVFSKAGNIEISISLYDMVDDKISFMWNTATYSGFSVATTMQSVEDYLPAKDEMLLIDAETRNIVAPSGYNNVMAYQGDKGIAKVYFTIRRIVRGIDVLGEGTKIFLYYQDKLVGTKKCSEITDQKKPLFYDAADKTNEGMVLLTWNVPDGPNDIVSTQYGKIPVAIQIGDGERFWNSKSYDSLEIAQNFSTITIEPDSVLEEYLKNTIWTIDANLTPNE